MIKHLKHFIITLMTGASVATVVLLLVTGYADRVSPERMPILSVLSMAFPLLLLSNLLLLLFWLAFKWRKAWIPLLGFLLAYVPIRTYMPLNRQQDVPEGSIKVVSYNVCAYGGNYKYEDAFERIVDYLKQQDADIVCLQEDIDTWRKYVFISYRKIFPYNDTTIFVNNAKAYNGVGLHTRFPIIRKERIKYPSAANGSMAYFLKREKDTLLVINNHLENTHLTLEDRNRYKTMLRGDMESDTVKAESRLLLDKLGQAAAIRAQAVDSIRHYIDTHSQYPVIVCGDFNDTPISYSRRQLAQGLTDCFVESGRGIGLSYNKKGFWVRIDHILCSSHFTPYNCEVDSKIDFSDHYPIVCQLKIKDK